MSASLEDLILQLDNKKRNRKFPAEQVRARKSYKWFQSKLAQIEKNTPEQNLKLLFNELASNGGFFTHRGALMQYKHESMELVLKDYNDNMAEQKIDGIMIVNDKEIKGFFRDYRWLSNFHPCKIEYDGQSYESTEAAYQAAKTLDLAERKRFETVTASESKSMGRLVSLRSDWEQVKDAVMYDILKYKFARHSDLRQKLLDTKEKYLEETNYWKDTYWGVCEGKGSNMLGQLLMLIRKEIENGTIL